MSDISYCDATWETVAGCTRCSPGCEHCWAVSTSRRKAGMAKRMAREGRDPGWLRHYNAVLTEKTPRTWNGRVELMPENLGLPLRWRKPQAIFVCSQADLFHTKVPFAFVNAMFGVMAVCPQHTFIVLSKRLARMLEWAEQATRLGWDCHAGEVMFCVKEANRACGMSQALIPDVTAWPPPNVCLGATVEDQPRLEERIGPLMKLARMGWPVWLSAEPLLGALDFGIPWGEGLGDLVLDTTLRTSRLSGIVVGGEAGPGSRPMHPDWPRRIRHDCAAARVPFYFKQWGDFLHCPATDVDAISPFWRVGKKAAGRLLDGVEHNALPWGRETV